MSKETDNEETISLLQHRLNQRGERLVVDGHGGAATRAALERRLADLAPVAGPGTVKLAADSPASAKHYALALPYKGLKEQAGSGTHPDLVPMFALTPSWLDRDDSKTAWCGIFRGWIGHRAGTGIPAEHYRAAAWEKWGKAVPLGRPLDWQKGDTIVMKRPGGYHVCLLDRVDGNHAWCLGGNQSNAVTVAKIAISEITAVRR